LIGHCKGKTQSREKKEHHSLHYSLNIDRAIKLRTTGMETRVTCIGRNKKRI